MRTRCMWPRAGAAALILCSVLLAGCKNGSSVTADEEQKFKNPPKEMPKEAVEFMKNHSAPPAGAQAPAGATSTPAPGK